jgi:butyryl-CoA dehydrogenase
LDFAYNLIQELVRKNVRRFAEEILIPIASELDRQSKRLPQEVIDLMGKQQLFGIQIGEKYEGAELDSISYVLAIEEISKACGATGLMTTVHNSVVAAPLEKFGTEEQKANYLSDLASGRKVGAFSITEPNAGSDAMGLLTIAEKDKDEWILNGQKCFVTNGGIAETFLIGAVHNRPAKAKGIGVFIVDKNTPGFKVGKIEEKLGVRSNPVSELFLDDVRIPQENVLGQPQDGFKIMMQTLDMGRIGIAAQGLGIAQAAYESAAKYANERRQFGKPIGEFQAIGFKLAEMRSLLDASRFLIYRAAWLKDQGLPFSVESAMAKMNATDAAMRVCTDAIQIFGAYGFIQDLPTERYFRDVKVTQIYEGTNEIMKIIIANAILKEFSPVGF